MLRPCVRARRRCCAEVCPVRRLRDQLGNRRSHRPGAARGLHRVDQETNRWSSCRCWVRTRPSGGLSGRTWPRRRRRGRVPSELAVARTAHPHIEFEEGQLDALPIETGALAGAVCWYSIIYTPPDRLAEAFGELSRVLTPGGYVLLAFQAEGEPVHRADAHGTDRHSSATGTVCRRLPAIWMTQVSGFTPRFSGHLNWSTKRILKGSFSPLAHSRSRRVRHGSSNRRTGTGAMLRASQRRCLRLRAGAKR